MVRVFDALLIEKIRRIDALVKNNAQTIESQKDRIRHLLLRSYN